MPTAGQHDESQITDIHQQGLVVDDQRVSLPAIVAERLVLRGHATRDSKPSRQFPTPSVQIYRTLQFMIISARIPLCLSQGRKRRSFQLNSISGFRLLRKKREM